MNARGDAQGAWHEPRVVIAIGHERFAIPTCTTNLHHFAANERHDVRRDFILGALHMTDTGSGTTNAGSMSADDPRIGSTLAGRFRIIAPLGEGGMGMVYRGVHEALRKPVAIKFLQQKITTNREMIARFEREAVTAANLRHPNIAEAIDYGSLPDGTLFLVMELVEGVSLRKIIPEGQGLPIERVMRILEQIAAALDLAHSMGIVHRDLKPENILVYNRGSENDIVKIIDFGIARITSEMFKTGPTALTAAGSVFGTPQYMAPEQVMGQVVDGRADQYAIGIILFEMLTGTLPFHADTYGELVMKQVGAPAPHIIERTAQVSEAVDAAVYQMMSKLPDERFATVTEALRAMKGEKPAPSLSANSLKSSPNTIVMQTPTSSSAPEVHTGAIAFAATIAPGELPSGSMAVSVVSGEISSARSLSASLPPVSVPDKAPPAPPSNQSIPTNTAVAAKSPVPIVPILGALVVLLGAIVVFLVARSPEPAQTPQSNVGSDIVPDDKSNPTSTSTSKSLGAGTTKTSSPSRAVSNTKYRLLLKDGKYPFCVTSKLKNAYPVRKNEEGIQMCMGTPDGSIPVDGLKPYNPSEFQWE